MTTRPVTRANLWQNTEKIREDSKRRAITLWYIQQRSRPKTGLWRPRALSIGQLHRPVRSVSETKMGKHFREVLKQQMTDSDSLQRHLFREKTMESKQAFEIDRTTTHNDAEEILKKRTYLSQFRDSNKRYMEERWERNRINRMQEQRIDSERLRYNPINWSCTLK